MVLQKKEIKLGKILIGGNSPVSIQSMTNTKTSHIKRTISQIQALENAGCEIIRVAILNDRDADAIRIIKKSIKIPLIADIHFNYLLALRSIEAGADGIRLNPGNIKDSKHIKQILKAAERAGTVIRIGVNSGSLDPRKYKKATPENMVHSLSEYIKLFEDNNFFNFKVSLKSSDVRTNVVANRIYAEQYPYPIHLGITEAGFSIIKGAIGIGSLLIDGIGNTIRVSLTSNPINEVYAAIKILNALNLRKGFVNVIACPTCGRKRINVNKIAKVIENKTISIKNLTKTLNIAIMGCVVNGLGEGKEADIGIAGTDRGAVLFTKGKKIGNLNNTEIIPTILTEIDKYK